MKLKPQWSNHCLNEWPHNKYVTYWQTKCTSSRCIEGSWKRIHLALAATTTFFLKKAPKNISLVAPLSLISSHATTKTNAFQKRRCQASLIGNKTNATFTKAVSCTVSRAAITNFNWSVIHHLSQKKHEIWNSKDSITNVKRSQTCKCSNRDCQNSYHELHVKPYRDMASIANFKKRRQLWQISKKKKADFKWSWACNGSYREFQKKTLRKIYRW